MFPLGGEPVRAALVSTIFGQGGGVQRLRAAITEQRGPEATAAWHRRSDYSMRRRAIQADTLPYCLSHGVGVIAYSPMMAGLLSGRMTRDRVAALPDDDWRKRTPEFQEPGLSANLELVEALRVVGARHGRSLGEVAVAWVLRHPAVTAAIVGFRRPRQVNEIVGAADLQLSEVDVGAIETAVARTSR